MINFRNQLSTLIDVPVPDTNANMKELLEGVDKELLVDFLLSLAAESDIVHQQIQVFFSKSEGEDELMECRELIRSFIAAFEDDHGFISWRNVSRAVEGAEFAADKARAAVDDGELLKAVKINLVIAEEMIGMLQVADDSDGTIGYQIEESHERIREIVIDSDISKTDQFELFKVILNESQQQYYEGWSDWKLDLLAFAADLIHTEDMRYQWEELTDKLVGEAENDSWSGNYLAEKISFLKYRLIQAFEGEHNAKKFLHNHLHFSDFRVLAIEDALHNFCYDEVIRLAEEGETSDCEKELWGLVTKWRKYRYEAYVRSGQKERQRELGQQLVVEGEYDYYHTLKDLYTRDEWKPIYQTILQKLETNRRNGEIYTRILIEEMEFERLLAYVEKVPHRIEQFYTVLFSHFPERVKELFLRYINKLAEYASKRKDYANVCRVIRLLQKCDGQDEALNVTRRLMFKYPRKPAFQDELGKLRLV